MPIGVTRRYYDEKGRCFRNQFVPIAYVFTKSETSTVFSFAHERLSWVLRRCLGMETIAFNALVADASKAIRGWLTFQADGLSDAQGLLQLEAATATFEAPTWSGPAAVGLPLYGSFDIGVVSADNWAGFDNMGTDGQLQLLNERIQGFEFFDEHGEAADKHRIRWRVFTADYDPEHQQPVVFYYDIADKSIKEPSLEDCEYSDPEEVLKWIVLTKEEEQEREAEAATRTAEAASVDSRSATLTVVPSTSPTRTPRAVGPPVPLLDAVAAPPANTSPIARTDVIIEAPHGLGASRSRFSSRSRDVDDFLGRGVRYCFSVSAKTGLMSVLVSIEGATFTPFMKPFNPFQLVDARGSFVPCSADDLGLDDDGAFRAVKGFVSDWYGLSDADRGTLCGDELLVDPLQAELSKRRQSAGLAQTAREAPPGPPLAEAPASRPGDLLDQLMQQEEHASPRAASPPKRTVAEATAIANKWLVQQSADIDRRQLAEGNATPASKKRKSAPSLDHKFPTEEVEPKDIVDDILYQLLRSKASPVAPDDIMTMAELVVYLDGTINPACVTTTKYQFLNTLDGSALDQFTTHHVEPKFTELVEKNPEVQEPAADVLRVLKNIAADPAAYYRGILDTMRQHRRVSEGRNEPVATSSTVLHERGGGDVPDNDAAEPPDPTEDVTGDERAPADATPNTNVKSHAGADTQLIGCLQENPKRYNSKSWHRYEAYKSARTVAEFFEKGGSPADLKHDVGRRYVWYVDPVAPTAPDAPRAAERPAGPRLALAGNTATVEPQAGLVGSFNDLGERQLWFYAAYYIST